jgi:hypothetical protein
VSLVPWDVDPAGLADHLRSVLGDDDTALTQLAEAGRAYARSWGFDDVVDRLLEIVTSLQPAAPRP